MAISQAFDLFPLNDAHFPTFLGRNEEDETLLHLDAAFAEELQFQEALKASLFTCQMATSEPSLQVEVKGESSLYFCEICRERKENDQLIKNGNCGHPFCLECISKHVEAKIKLGLKIFTCPGLNCECVLQLETFKHFLSKDVLSQWEEALSTELAPNFTCRGFYAKPGSENGNGKHFPARTSKILSPPEVNKTVQFSHCIAGTNDSAEADSKQIVHKRKYEETASSNAPNKFLLRPRAVRTVLHKWYDSHSALSFRRGNKGPKSACSSFKDIPATFDGIPPMGPILNRQCSNDTAADDYDNDSDSDTLPDTDDYDSEASPRSPRSCKKSKWFKKFLKGFEYLSAEEINDPARQWHCPACQGGAGAIKRYLGLQILIKHAKTKGSRRMRLHRELAQLLEEKLHSNLATSAAIGDEACGKWKGLKEENKDHEIVWPPMVLITNTSHKKNENNKWIGMSNQQLLDLFSSYNAVVKVQHLYNSNGHCGKSILIFESSLRGYLEAEWLHMHFAKEGVGRSAWNNQPVYFLPSGERQLHGFMAVKEDVDTFNQYYSKGKPKLKFEMRSYQEMVVNQIRQMIRDNLQLPLLHNRIIEQQNHAKGLEESNGMLKMKLDKATKDMEILRRKAKYQHEQYMEEVEFIEQFYEDRIKNFLEATKENDGEFENAQQKELQENAEQSNAKIAMERAARLELSGESSSNNV
ncbi:protein SUPPRESSOR OF GENE SILENCING 3 homolog isoform X2 [Manihot esculenta]|uniref:protein SUPPRESSOR OF GENE SILENCING 3 homolog isoform X2 n=1 Tax=Manihot esculenta TaxID=3983 RepID=UPI000B5D1B6F|nr:protein SUPPRESSOR OF GENE SILENCING 3 homolog isoform X2 [Manihot esculenta]